MQHTVKIHYWVIIPINWLKDYFSRPSMFCDETRVEGLKLDFRLSRPIKFCLKRFIASVSCLFRLLFIVGVVSFLPAFVLRIGLPWLTGQLPSFTIQNIAPLLLTTALGSLGGMAVSLTFGLISGKAGIISFLMIGAITADIPFGGTLGITQNISLSWIATLVSLPLVAGGAAIIGLWFFMHIRQKKRLNWQEAGKIFTVASGGILIALVGALTMVHFHIAIDLISEQENIVFLAFENLVVGFLLSYILNPRGWIFGVMIFVIQAFLVSTPSFIILAGLAFFFGYWIGSYHLPIYLYRCISMWRTYHKSNSSMASGTFSLQVFSNLKYSALYKDERVRLPLPYLKDTLSLAVQQDRRLALTQKAAFPDFDNTMKIIDYIVSKRSIQCNAAYAVIVDIILNDLLSRTKLTTIAQVSQQFLTDYLSRKPGLIDPDWTTTFKDLNDFSKEASNYISANSKQQRQTLLDNMKVCLDRIVDDPPRSYKHKKHLDDIIERWTDCHSETQKKLNTTANDAGSLDNLYIPDRPFTGNDLPRHAIFDELQRRFLLRGKTSETYSPRLFIVGEPRTGKTSILYQLGARSLLIIYNLRSGMLASKDTLFTSLADAIQKRMFDEGWNIKTFNNSNAAANYYHFNHWLKQVEETLAQKKHILILAFDNFEVPEVLEHKQYSNNDLLLGWFNSIEQGYPRIVLLLCGTQKSSEVKREWGEFLTNFPKLNVGFLQESEAANLITHFSPGQDVFDATVKQEIIRLTNGHPFLLQAFCATLIDYLNINLEERATLEHVEGVIGKFYATWDKYFNNLWNSLDEEQQRCLRQLTEKGGKDSIQNLDYEIGAHKDYLRLILEPLVERDIVRVDHDQCEIIIPLLYKFIEMKNK